MKKITNRLILVVFLSIIAVALCGIIAMLLQGYSNPLSGTFESTVNSIDKSFPGAGEAFLILGGSSLFLEFFGAVGIILLYCAIFLLIPFNANVIAFILILIGRLFQIGEEQKWKNTTSFVFAILSIVLQALLCLFLIIFGFLLKTIMILLPLLCAICFVIWSILELKKAKI